MNATTKDTKTTKVSLLLKGSGFHLLFLRRVPGYVPDDPAVRSRCTECFGPGFI